jgi:hypothetical protein
MASRLPHRSHRPQCANRRCTASCSSVLHVSACQTPASTLGQAATEPAPGNSSSNSNKQVPVCRPPPRGPRGAPTRPYASAPGPALRRAEQPQRRPRAGAPALGLGKQSRRRLGGSLGGSSATRNWRSGEAVPAAAVHTQPISLRGARAGQLARRPVPGAAAARASCLDSAATPGPGVPGSHTRPAARFPVKGARSGRALPLSCRGRSQLRAGAAAPASPTQDA